jgi:ribonuclease D
VSRTLLVVDDDKSLNLFCDRWLGAFDGAEMALDIEEDREYGYRATVALIQLSLDTHDFILDPVLLQPGALAPVVEALCLTTGRMIMHGCNNDVTGLKRDFGVGPASMVDTQVAARFLGSQRFGLAGLLDEYFGIRLNKDVRRSNWRLRPLQHRLLEYAREDTAHLVPLWRTLEAECEAAGWMDAVHEECQALADLRAESLDFDPEGWRRFKGLKDLDRDTLARLAALWEWRDGVGARMDRHPSRVMAPWAMIQLAERGVDALNRGIPQGLEPSIYVMEEQDLRDLLRSARTVAPLEGVPRRDKPSLSSAAFQLRVERLNHWREATAQASGLEPGWLAPRTVLENLARLEDVTPDAIACIDGVRKWRLDRYLDDWLRLLHP